MEQGGWRINVEEGAIRDTTTVHDYEEKRIWAELNSDKYIERGWWRKIDEFKLENIKVCVGTILVFSISKMLRKFTVREYGWAKTSNLQVNWPSVIYRTYPFMRNWLFLVDIFSNLNVDLCKIYSLQADSELGFNNEVACSINIRNYHGIYTVIHALSWLECSLNCYGWSPGVVH